MVAIPSEPVSLIVVEGAADDTLRVAHEIGRQHVPPEFHSVDVVVAEPASERWTVDELVEYVINPSRQTPYGDRRVVVMRRADRIAANAADRLLLVTEDSPNTFVLCVSSLADLPDTLIGRAAYTLTADDDGKIGALLVAAGHGAADVAAVVQGFGHLPGWLAAAVNESTVFEALSTLSQRPAGMPLSAAQRTHSQLETLAAFDTSSGERAGSKPDKTARERVGALAAVNHWRHVVGAVPPVDVDQRRQALDLLELAATGLERNLHVLSALTIACRASLNA